MKDFGQDGVGGEVRERIRGDRGLPSIFLY